MDTNKKSQEYQQVLRQKLTASNLQDFLNIFHNAANIEPAALLDGNINDIENIINEQVSNFMNILREVKKLKEQDDDDQQFHNELANDIGGFDIMDDLIPAVFPDDNIKTDPDAIADVAAPAAPAAPGNNIDDPNSHLVKLGTMSALDNIDSPKSISIQPSNASSIASPNSANSINNDPPPGYQSQPQVIQPKPKPDKPALSPMEQLKNYYKKEEKHKQSKQKVKLKLKVGYVVDIYSASKKIWSEGIIKEIKGDVLCVVYGKKMKWLKKNSKQLRPKAQMIQQAMNQ